MKKHDVYINKYGDNYILELISNEPIFNLGDSHDKILYYLYHLDLFPIESNRKLRDLFHKIHIRLPKEESEELRLKMLVEEL